MRLTGSAVVATGAEALCAELVTMFLESAGAELDAVCKGSDEAEEISGRAILGETISALAGASSIAPCSVSDAAGGAA